MASAFKPAVPVLGWRRRNPEIIYHFNSLNHAASFTCSDVKSVMQVCRWNVSLPRDGYSAMMVL